MTLIAFTCAHCGATAAKEAGHVNRSRRRGAALYCDKSCSSHARRIEKTREQKAAEKAEYDRMYRAREAETLKAKKAAYYQRTADREKEREDRKRRMPQHVEYCRRPEYREWKKRYDRQYLARKKFGDFGEAAIILNDLIAEINSRSTRTEIYRQNGTLNKWIARRRDYERQTDRR